MDQDAWEMFLHREGLLTEQAGCLVEEFGDEGIDLLVVWVGWVLSLFEEVGGGVLQGLHGG